MTLQWAPWRSGVSIFCFTVGPGADERKYQISAPLAFVRGDRWIPCTKGQYQEMSPFDDVILNDGTHSFADTTRCIAITPQNHVDFIIFQGILHAPNAARTISCKAWHSPVEYPSRECKHDIKESKGNMLNRMLKEKAQGRTHPGSCAFAAPELLR